MLVFLILGIHLLYFGGEREREREREKRLCIKHCFNGHTHGVYSWPSHLKPRAKNIIYPTSAPTQNKHAHAHRHTHTHTHTYAHTHTHTHTHTQTHICTHTHKQTHIQTNKQSQPWDSPWGWQISATHEEIEFGSVGVLLKVLNPGVDGVDGVDGGRLDALAEGVIFCCFLANTLGGPWWTEQHFKELLLSSTW